MTISLVIADDHPILLDGLSSLLEREKDFQILARCSDGNESLLAVRQHRPDVLLLDVLMPRKSGLEILQILALEKSPTRTVILTAGLTADQTVEAIRLGVAGVVLKEMAPSLLIRCIRKVAAGDVWLERQSFSDALETVIRRQDSAEQLTKVLSRRELQVTRMVASGMRNREIGKRLFISEGTVKVHLHNIYEKLKMENRLSLTLFARRKGLLDTGNEEKEYVEASAMARRHSQFVQGKL
ncbi:MAG TPA: response regulator transcription factor [Candidatus Binatia bacterium]|jgi:DNA-binding NarL/FixJ family response regulator